MIAALLLLLMISSSLNVQSQVSRSAWFLEDLPGSNTLNPAFNPSCRFYVNLPVISSFYLGFESPFTFNDLTEPYPTGDSLYIDRETVLSRLNERNYFSFELYNELGKTGVRFGRHHLDFSITKVFSTKFSFDEKFIRLLLYGNGSPAFLGKHIEINGNGLNMTSYHQFAFGYALDISDRFTAGMKFKYLNGAFNIWTEKADISLFTDPNSGYALTVSSDIRLHTSSTISDFDNLIDQIENYRWFDLTSNHGYAFDVGWKYNLSEKVGLSGSVIDMGSIFWRQNVKNFKSSDPGKEFTFTGFDIDYFINDNTFGDSISIADTLAKHFGLDEIQEAYRSRLNPKIYLGGLYRITPKDHFGLLVRNDIAEKSLHPSFTVSYLRYFGELASLYINYSVLSNNYFNFGFGGSVRIGPVEAYILNDMAYALLEPSRSRSYNIHFGITFLFGKGRVIETPEEDSGRSFETENGM